MTELNHSTRFSQQRNRFSLDRGSLGVATMVGTGMSSPCFGWFGPVWVVYFTLELAEWTINSSGSATRWNFPMCRQCNYDFDGPECTQKYVKIQTLLSDPGYIMWLVAFLCSLVWNSLQHYMSEPWRVRLRSNSAAVTDITIMDDDTFVLGKLTPSKMNKSSDNFNLPWNLYLIPWHSPYSSWWTWIPISGRR